MSRPFFFNQVASIRLRVPLRMFGSVILGAGLQYGVGRDRAVWRLRLPVVHNGTPCGVSATVRRAVATNSTAARWFTPAGGFVFWSARFDCAYPCGIIPL